MQPQHLRLAILMLIGLLFAGCGSSSSPADVTLRYLQAKAGADEAAIGSLICAELEGTVRAEATSFGSVNASLKEANCTSQPDSDIVSCTGAIVAEYGTEVTSFPLKSYRVTQEDGEYKWCGEAQ